MKKVALVTGSSRGIGRACAIAFVKEGAKVVIPYFNGIFDGNNHTICQLEPSEVGVTFANIYAVPLDGTITFLFAEDVDGVPGTCTTEEPTEVGSYWVKCTSETTDTLYGSETEPQMFSIGKGDNEFTKIIKPDYHAGSTPSTPEITTKFGGEVTFAYSTSETGPFTDEIPTEPGTYYMKATSEASDNYISRDRVVIFHILDPIESETGDEEPESNEVKCIFHYILIGIAALLIVATLIYFFHSYNKNVVLLIAGASFIISTVCGIIGMSSGCGVCVVFFILNILLIGLYYWLFKSKSKNKKDNKSEQPKQQ